MAARSTAEETKYHSLGISTSVLDFGSEPAVMSRPSPSADILFCKDVPTRLHISHRDERTTQLTTQISMLSPASTQHSQSAQMRVLQFQLTDPHDPFFFYSLDVSESDFHILKKEQSLLVDFAAFPAKFIELLEQCILNAQQESPKFVLSLSVGAAAGSAVLAVTEINQFKQLQHLSLLFRQGTDASVKRYLADQMTEFKTRCAHLEQSLQERSRECDALANDLRGSRDAVNRLQRSEAQNLADLKTKYSAELSDLREQALTAQRELQSQLEAKARQAEADFRGQMSSVQTRFDEVARKNSELTEAKYNLENQMQQLASALRAHQTELTEAKDELARLRSSNRSLDATKFENEKTVSQLTLRIAGLEQQVKDKDEFVRTTNALLDAAREQKAALEESLRVAKERNDQADGRVKEASEEINKGNQIIQHLQTELRNAKSKLKLKAAVIVQQEQALEQKSAALNESERKVTEAEAKISLLQLERNKQGTENELLRQQVEECQKQLLSNKKVIEWLNKELNDARLGRVASEQSPHGADISSRSSNTLSRTAGQRPSTLLSAAATPGFSNTLLSQDRVFPPSAYPARPGFTLSAEFPSLPTSTMSSTARPYGFSTSDVFASEGLFTPSYTSAFLSSAPVSTQSPAAAAGTGSSASATSSYFSSTATRSASSQSTVQQLTSPVTAAAMSTASLLRRDPNAALAGTPSPYTAVEKTAPSSAPAPTTSTMIGQSTRMDTPASAVSRSRSHVRFDLPTDDNADASQVASANTTAPARFSTNTLRA